jgi:hypothetical protein
MAESSPSRRRAYDSRERFDAALASCRHDLERAERSDGFERLRGPVITFVHAARECGTPPERTLAAFKVMLRAVAAVESRSLLERSQLTSWLAQTAIEAYYNGVSPPTPAPGDTRLDDVAAIAPNEVP